MASTSSKVIPYIVVATIIATLGVDVYSDFELTEQHITLLGTLMATLGLGGVYNGIRKGFVAAQEIRRDTAYEEIKSRLRRDID